jgi:RHS repeat-associated protein
LTASETPKVDSGSNRLLGFSVLTTTSNGTQSSTSSRQVSYTVDANGNMTSDGLRTFVYDASNRLAKVEAVKNGDAVGVEYLHNALGQRVFKSDPVTESTASLHGKFGNGFIGWLKSNFGWLFAPGQRGKSRLGLAFVYDEQGNLIASYSDGSNNAAQQQMEIIWLPLEDGTSIPVGVLKNGNFYAVHTDHLGTPRLITDSTKTPVWQWPYSAFGNNKPTGPLSTVAIKSTSGATTTQLKATAPALESNLRFPGQYWDSESYLTYNGWRSYRPFDASYTQMDPAGLSAGSNRRIYVDGNTLSGTDQSGLACRWLGVALLCEFNAPPAYDPRTDTLTPASSGWSLPSLPNLLTPKPTLSDAFPPGVWQGDKGAAEWGRRNGVGQREGKGRFHGIKQDCGGRGADNFGVNPDTGDVYDPEGHVVGNLDDVKSK